MPYINGNKVLGVTRTKYLNVDDVYPIGAVYISFDSTSPAQLFGGTWERLNNAFLYATNNDNNIGDTGGEETHTLSVDEMPSHRHSITASGDSTPWISRINATIEGGNYRGTADVCSSTGGGQAHNNMPPYIKVAIWKRIADPQEE